ncbi:MAG: dTDP-4-dehydrorhamnose 3,5-epimerase [Fidelibacterota bacterium]
MSKENMEILPTAIPDIVHLRPEAYPDPRGEFMENYREERYKELGIPVHFVQDNLVYSRNNVFRGMHFQLPPFAQAKLITMISGKILDIVLDLRKNSETYLKTMILTLSSDNNDQLYIPEGFAHGYYVLSEISRISYKVSQVYAPDHQAGIRWDDEILGLKKYFSYPLLSAKDQKLRPLKEILSVYKL